MLVQRHIRKILLLGALLWVAALVVVIPLLLQMGSVRRVRGWVSSDPGPPIIQSVTPGGPAEGLLQPGDRIVSVDGKSGFAGSYLPVFVERSYPVGKPYTLTIVRNGSEHRVTLRSTSVPDRSVLLFLWCDVLGSVTFLTLGLLMGWQKPQLRTARLGFLACFFTSALYLHLALLTLGQQGWYTGFAPHLLRMAGSLDLLAAWWFVADFEAPTDAAGGVIESRGWRAIRLVLLTVCLVEWISRSIVNPTLSGFGLHPEYLVAVSALWYRWLNLLYTVTHAALLPAFIGVLVRNYRAATTMDSRRRIEIAAGAVVFGTGFVILASLWHVRLAQAGNLQAADLVLMTGNLAPLFIPWCFYYAVVRHRVLDLRVVIRRTLQYLLARQFLRLATILPLPLILYRVWRDPLSPVSTVFNRGAIIVVIAAILLAEFREPILAAMDRWFFREAADREQSLRGLYTTVGRLPSEEEIIVTVKARLVAVFLAAPVEVVLDPGVSLPSAPGEGLCLPVHTLAGERAGYLLLGPKRSEEPYTAAERDLLETLAAQIGLVVENLRLVARRFDAVVAERTRIARELHDTLSQSFSGISLYLEVVRSSMTQAPEKAREYLDAARALSRESIQDAREALRELRTPPNRSHIVTRLRSLGDSCQPGPGVSAEIDDRLADLIPPEAGWHLARIAEEAVANARKHSRATEVRIQLAAENGQLILRVHDNGSGFDLAQTTTGFGLVGMRERMAQLGGSMEINSQPGGGTEIRATIAHMVIGEEPLRA
jgi:signal transduction histidine kinase